MEISRSPAPVTFNTIKKDVELTASSGDYVKEQCQKAVNDAIADLMQKIQDKTSELQGPRDKKKGKTLTKEISKYRADSEKLVKYRDKILNKSQIDSEKDATKLVASTEKAVKKATKRAGITIRVLNDLKEMDSAKGQFSAQLKQATAEIKEFAKTAKVKDSFFAKLKGVFFKSKPKLSKLQTLQAKVEKKTLTEAKETTLKPTESQKKDYRKKK